MSKIETTKKLSLKLRSRIKRRKARRAHVELSTLDTADKPPPPPNCPPTDINSNETQTPLPRQSPPTPPLPKIWLQAIIIWPTIIQMTVFAPHCKWRTTIISSVDNIGNDYFRELGMKVLRLMILSSTTREGLFTQLFLLPCKIIV